MAGQKQKSCETIPFYRTYLGSRDLLFKGGGGGGGEGEEGEGGGGGLGGLNVVSSDQLDGNLKRACVEGRWGVSYYGLLVVSLCVIITFLYSPKYQLPITNTKYQ